MMSPVLEERGVSTPTFNMSGKKYLLQPELNENMVKKTIARKKREAKMSRVVQILVGVGMVDKYQKLSSPNKKIGFFQKKSLDRRPVLIFAVLDSSIKNPSLKENYEDPTRVKYYRFVYFPSAHNKNKNVLKDATFFDIPVSSLERKNKTPLYNNSNLSLQSNSHQYSNSFFKWDWTVYGRQFPARFQTIEKNGKEATRVIKNLALINEYSLIPQITGNQDISTVYDYLLSITQILNKIQSAKNNMEGINQVVQNYRNKITIDWYELLVRKIQELYDKTKERTALAYATYRTLVQGARKDPTNKSNVEWQPTTRASSGKKGMLRSLRITKGLNNKGQVIYSNDIPLWYVYILFHFNMDDKLRTILNEDFTTNTGKFLEISHLVQKIMMEKINEVSNVKTGYDELKQNPEHFETFLKQFFGKNSLRSIVANDESIQKMSETYRNQANSTSDSNTNQSNNNSQISKNYVVV